VVVGRGRGRLVVVFHGALRSLRRHLAGEQRARGDVGLAGIALDVDAIAGREVGELVLLAS
jgi:hypothetical protein